MACAGLWAAATDNGHSPKQKHMSTHSVHKPRRSQCCEAEIGSEGAACSMCSALAGAIASGGECAACRSPRADEASLPWPLGCEVMPPRCTFCTHKPQRRSTACEQGLASLTVLVLC
jgi:hypothetical protein